MTTSSPILPGSTIGILGGGQLGRMMSIAAKRMGYRVIILDPIPDSPAAQVSDGQIVALYDDIDAARRLAAASRVVTIEFENIPAATLEAIEPLVPVRPSSRVVRVCQHRIAEKTFLRDHGSPVTAFRAVKTQSDLQSSIKAIGCPSILKTATGGYDGKGQLRLDSPTQAAEAWQWLQGREAILEAFVNLDKEISVIVARSPQGQVVCYPPSENTHAHHILDTAVMPAVIPDTLLTQARDIATRIAVALDIVGLLTVEMFVAKDGRLLINELAPRPHNSGHQTFDGAITSQFEQAVRAVCGLPLGSADLYHPTAIANLLGNLWSPHEPNWQRVLAMPDIKLHLYGKSEARPGRKMGHLTASATTPQEALQKVIQARVKLST
ncbi:MAG: 5-(carboxyamino)imidazole ribonucleotide synthase [SAR202 cluster bacterium]|nr:5-(carboxyamino)imidazole ribonucleotide synthase [SAR202 cluster bacterium]